MSEHNEVPRLKDAKLLGQLVKGTSEDSRYVCVYRSCVNMAVRLAGNKLSVRVEAVDPEAFSEAQAKQLIELGLSVHDSSYASVHVNVSSAQQGFMATAAFIAGCVSSPTLSKGTLECVDYVALTALSGKGA